MNFDYMEDIEVITFFKSISSILSLYEEVVHKSHFMETNFGVWTLNVYVNQNFLAYVLADEENEIQEVLQKTVVVPLGFKLFVNVIKDY